MMKTIMAVLCLLVAVALATSPLMAKQQSPDPSQDGTQEEALPEPEVAADDPAEMAPEEPLVVLMNSRWAELACEAWNEDPTLTGKLAAPGWVANNKDRGHKVIQMYRTDCETSPWVELQIADQDEQARCVYGGPVKTEELIDGVDYIMHAQTKRWQEMGAGNYGPMKGMMTGRLKFKGPKWEAMKNMGPFTSFLRLAGAVASDASACPAMP